MVKLQRGLAQCLYEMHATCSTKHLEHTKCYAFILRLGVRHKPLANYNRLQTTGRSTWDKRLWSCAFSAALQQPSVNKNPKLRGDLKLRKLFSSLLHNFESIAQVFYVFRQQLLAENWIPVLDLSLKWRGKKRKAAARDGQYICTSIGVSRYFHNLSLSVS